MMTMKTLNILSIISQNCGCGYWKKSWEYTKFIASQTRSSYKFNRTRRKMTDAEKAAAEEKRKQKRIDKKIEIGYYL